jgi:outer membrane protein assembly factor BamE
MPDFDFPRARLSLFVVACVMLAGCGSFNSASSGLANMITPYKIDVVQGNFVSKEQADALVPGMPREQVRGILGSPLLTSIFHANRWDYVFTFKRQGLPPQARRVTVFFKDDVLERFEADALPTEAEFVASLDSGRKTGKVPVLEATEEQLKATAAVPAKVVVPEPLPPLPASYPPLEPAAR